MLAQTQLIGFIPTVDADRARKFYVDTLGLTFVSDDEFAIVVRSGGIDIRISRIAAFNPSPHTILGWKVPSIDASVQQFAAAGIKFERYPFLEQDASGIWTAPDGAAKVAWFKDPDGNVLSLSQHASV
ncbi:VOC family protein [Edaphobacter modestus]|uniref:Catechol 2,3-dioxygenase-like lactoylglutathione lyase family enzyme n=1 Tax=Edaphobacter modestus TaxID=388466 RepID=A0A4Q7YV71_9BACT|nr:VOC family protein [Edaphobacter modestus]RZU40943.1 catechol 2,3-dioxygenase-like lactoylglutathione lyase family enzyme [Edaphobacter modestus]